MSTKGDDEQFTLEKFRSTYTDITLNPGSKSNTLSSSTTTALLASNKVTSHQLSIVSATGDGDIETTHTQLKQVAERKIPPYTNTNFHSTSSNVRATKANTMSSSPEISTNTACKKQNLPVVSESTVTATSKITSVKPNISLNIIEKPTQIIKSQGDKILTSYLIPSETCSSSSPDIQDQITQFPSNLEKNIQSNVLTFTRTNPSRSPTAVGSSSTNSNVQLNSKESKTVAKNHSNAEIFKPQIKSGRVKPSIEINNKIISPKILCASGVQGVNSRLSSASSSSEMSKNVQAKIMVSEGSKNMSSKQQNVVTSSTETAKTANEITSTSPKQSIVKVSTRPQKSKTVLSVNPRTIIQESIQVQTVPSNISSNPSVTLVQLSSLTDLDSNQTILDALNSGSNVNVTQSVTISKPALPAIQGSVNFQQATNIVVPIVVQQTMPNTKNKTNMSCEAVLKANNSNVTEMNQSLSPRSDASRETIALYSPANDDGSKFDISSSFCVSSDDMDVNDDLNSPRKKHEEPECLTISSDEETEESQEFAGMSETSNVTVSVMNKEPPLMENNEKQCVAVDGSICKKEEENCLDITNGEGYVNLTCRTVRIGSYKFSPRVPIILSKYGLRIVIPGSENIVLKIPNQEITRVLIHFGKSIPVIFYYVTVGMGAKVRNILNMTDPQDVYFNPASRNESQRRITLLPDKFTDDDRDEICEIFKDSSYSMFELNHEEANELLVRSAPRDVPRVIKQVPNRVQTIMVFPPPPAKGGISINTEDYSCLAADVFLNDVIIDFYLKYLYLNHLSEEDREKTHIFSSFFYKRLTDKATPMSRHMRSGGNVITASDIRHSRVKNWTKNIDIFSKDYIVIPLNENQHWFLAIICFPGLTGPVRYSDDSPIEVELKEKKPTESTSKDNSRGDEENQSTITIGSTTITPLRLESKENEGMFSVDEDNDGEDRDEAEGTDEDINISEEENEEESSNPDAEIEGRRTRRVKLEREPIKQPCILIFDSLAGASRARIIATLRDYLRVEYRIKHGKERDFSKNVVKGAVPSVPQQDNFTDCGLYVLQYVEAFFDDKIPDYHLPIKTLRDWFPSEIVSRKRYDIQQLLLKLMEQQNIDIESLNLPKLHLSHLSQSDDEYEYDSEFYEDDEEEFQNDSDYDMEMHELHQHHGLYHEQYHVESEEGEYYEEDEEDEEVMAARSRYDIFDSEDEIADADMDSDEDNSDEDIMYKDLEDMQAERTRKYRRSLHRRMEESAQSDEEEEKEEEFITDDGDTEEQLLSSDIEERISNTNLNRETVSIKLTPINSRMHSSAGNSNSSSVNDNLTKLKTRPWRTVDQSNDDCSSKKKFKEN